MEEVPPPIFAFACGSNRYGQLGQGQFYGTYALLTRVSGQGWYPEMHVGQDHALILGGGVMTPIYVCGRNDRHQLGLGDTTSRASLTSVSPDSGTVWSMAVGGNGLTFAFHNNTNNQAYTDLLIARALGRNDYGQLGVGDTTDRTAWTLLDKATNYYWYYLNPGSYHAAGACCLSLGNAHIWGRNNRGQLGRPDLLDQPFPVLVPSPQPEAGVEYIACGHEHSLLLCNDGTLWATGRNDRGQLGLGDTTDRHTWTQVPGSWASVICFGNFTVAFKTTSGMRGSLWACGANNRGQLGLGDTIDRTALTQIGTATDWYNPRYSVSACGHEPAGHFLAIKGAGYLHAWGTNDRGQLGLGDYADRHEPTLVTSSGSAEDYTWEWVSLGCDEAGEAFTWAVTDGLYIPPARQVDYKPSSYDIQDQANRDLQGREASKQITLGMFQKTAYAARAADRLLKSGGYPLASVSFKANRAAFRLRPGDLFVLDYAPMGLADMVCRVVQVQEAALDANQNEILTIQAVEAVEYLSGIMDAPAYWRKAGQGQGPSSGAIDPDNTLKALTQVTVFEAPYALAGPACGAVMVAGREVLRELGFGAYYSLDDQTYGRLQLVGNYAVHGTLVDEYPADTLAIDDSLGLLVEFDNRDAETIDTISRTYLLAGGNLALLGDEIVCFQTVTPITATQYRLTGVRRGLLDTAPVTHTAGTGFWFLDQGQYGLLSEAQMLPGSTRYFKAVPFSSTVVGDISEATTLTLALTGRAFKPYAPSGFQCNGGGNIGTYQTDCLLTWSPRLRDGLGAGLATEVNTDAAPTWEGVFEVEMWEPNLAGTRTGLEDNIAAATVTMTPTLGGPAVFRLRNKLTTAGVVYASDWTVIAVRKV